MKPDKMNEINDKYGCTLEDLSFMLAFGCCERLLPYPKEEIEQALLAQALRHSAKGDKEALETMLYAYASLASFLPYNKYNLIKRYYSPESLAKSLKENDFRDRLLISAKEIKEDAEKRLAKIRKSLNLKTSHTCCKNRSLRRHSTA